MTCMYGLLQCSHIKLALVSLIVKLTFSTLEWNSTHLCTLYLFTGTLHQNWDHYGDSPWLLMIRKCCPYRPTIGCMHHAFFMNIYTTIYTTSFISGVRKLHIRWTPCCNSADARLLGQCRMSIEKHCGQGTACSWYPHVSSCAPGSSPIPKVILCFVTVCMCTYFVF